MDAAPAVVAAGTLTGLLVAALAYAAADLAETSVYSYTNGVQR